MSNLSRRDTLKLFAAASIVAASSSTLDASQNSDIKSNIVILGAGLGGISLATKLIKEMPNARITLIDKDEKFYYQPGYTLIAIGIYTKDDVVFDKADYIPDGAKWIKQNVKSINPTNNTIILEDQSNLSYDYLIIATGVEYDFEAIKGLSAVDITTTNISSIYTLDSAVKTNELMVKFANNGGNGVFVEQKTPMKCSGANKKVAMMSEDRVRLAGNRDKATIRLFGGSAKLFSSPIYEKAMEKIFIKRQMKYNLRHHIIEIDKSRNVAIFEHSMPYRENGINKVAKEYIEAKFDWLHLTPKQRASSIYKDAGLSIENGDVDGNWVAVNKETLQSLKYKNIFAIGDVCGFPMGKTGASIRKMYPILTKNLISVIQGKEPKEKYDGYTACPLVTRYGKAVMVEFNWTSKAVPSMPCFGATRESYINWFVKLHLFKPAVMQGMLRGLV